MNSSTSFCAALHFAQIQGRAVGCPIFPQLWSFVGILNTRRWMWQGHGCGYTLRVTIAWQWSGLLEYAEGRGEAQYVNLLLIYFTLLYGLYCYIWLRWLFYWAIRSWENYYVVAKSREESRSCSKAYCHGKRLVCWRNWPVESSFGSNLRACVKTCQNRSDSELLAY